MKRNFLTMLFLILLVVLANQVKAQSQVDRTDARQTMQRTRMVDGRASGEITQGENRLLRSEQRHIRRAERRTEADGVITPKEKARLDRKQNRASRHIRRAKHNPVNNK